MEIDNITRLPHFYSQRQYSKEAKLSVNTAGNRIRSKLVAAIKVDGKWFIDTQKSPTNANYSGKKRKAFAGASLPAGINKSRLRHVKTYALKSGHTDGYYFTAIISGKLKAVVLGEEVFAYQDELSKI